MKLESAENFQWTPHRFSGGRLVLDICNTVILRHDVSRSIDRWATPEHLKGFAAAATKMGAEEWSLDDLAGDPGNVIDLREAADRHFRAIANQTPNDLKLADLLEQCVIALRGVSNLATSTAHSALRLIAEGPTVRIKICEGCGWLFHDKSKNQTRIWCDMAVCGNRTKARRNYSKRRMTS
jgi:predicted RNA-binding Zn ribbon-like protein